MEELSRSFRLQRSDSYLGRIVGRSHSSRHVLESVGPEFAEVAGYRRLSQSMRLFEEEPTRRRRHQKAKVWRFLTHVFSRKDGNEDEEGKRAKEDKRKRSAWLPDPERRWPLQGW